MLRTAHWWGLGVMLLALGARASGSHPNSYLAVADQHIIPAYQQLAKQTAHLHAAATAHCETDPASLRQPFADAFLAWQSIQHLRFGPVQVLARDFRFQLWPDKRGSVRKHLARLIASHDRDRLDLETFAAGSAAVQGFGALERLLYGGHFDTANPTERAWICDLVRTMTGNHMRMAEETLHEWRAGDQPHRAMFATAADGNAFYDSADELGARLLNNLHAQLERIADQKLGRPLGSGPTRTLPKRAEAWRSGLSLRAIRTNLQALRQLYTTGFATHLDDANLHARIDQAFAASLNRLNALPDRLSEALADDASYAALVELRMAVSKLKTLIGNDLSNALGLPLGFNSLDGD